MPGWGQHGASSLLSFLKHPGEGISRIYLASYPATQGRNPSNFHVLLYEEYERIWDTCTVANLLPQESWLGERPSLEHRENSPPLIVVITEYLIWCPTSKDISNGKICRLDPLSGHFLWVAEDSCCYLTLWSSLAISVPLQATQWEWLLFFHGVKTGSKNWCLEAVLGKGGGKSHLFSNQERPWIKDNNLLFFRCFLWEALPVSCKFLCFMISAVKAFLVGEPGTGWGGMN